jgi:hypothetical protein
MALFYKGIGPGTFHSGTDLRSAGLSPRDPNAWTSSIHPLMAHICDGTTIGGYISLTRSFGVARDYAFMGRIPPSSAYPGYVWEIEIGLPLPSGVRAVLDPVCEVASTTSGTTLSNISYHHDGDQNFLLGVVDPSNMSHYLAAPVHDPPWSSRPSRPAHRSKELETIVMTLRDAEVLVVGDLPGTCFKRRHAVP